MINRSPAFEELVFGIGFRMPKVIRRTHCTSTYHFLNLSACGDRFLSGFLQMHLPDPIGKPLHLRRSTSVAGSMRSLGFVPWTERGRNPVENGMSETCCYNGDILRSPNQCWIAWAVTAGSGQGRVTSKGITENVCLGDPPFSQRTSGNRFRLEKQKNEVSPHRNSRLNRPAEPPQD